MMTTAVLSGLSLVICFSLLGNVTLEFLYSLRKPPFTPNLSPVTSTRVVPVPATFLTARFGVTLLVVGRGELVALHGALSAVGRCRCPVGWTRRLEQAHHRRISRLPLQPQHRIRVEELRMKGSVPGPRDRLVRPRRWPGMSAVQATVDARLRRVQRSHTTMTAQRMGRWQKSWSGLRGTLGCPIGHRSHPAPRFRSASN